MSKGSKQRPTDQKAYDEGYERAFGKPAYLPKIGDKVTIDGKEMEIVGEVVSETVTVLHELH